MYVFTVANDAKGLLLLLLVLLRRITENGQKTGNMEIYSLRKRARARLATVHDRVCTHPQGGNVHARMKIAWTRAVQKRPSILQTAPAPSTVARAAAGLDGRWCKCRPEPPSIPGP